MLYRIFFFHTKFFFFRYITNILNSEFFSLKLKLTWPRILSRFSHFGQQAFSSLKFISLQSYENCKRVGMCTFRAMLYNNMLLITRRSILCQKQQIRKKKTCVHAQGVIPTYKLKKIISSCLCFESLSTWRDSRRLSVQQTVI